MMILFTRNNIASANIADKLVKHHGFGKAGEGEWVKDGVRMIDTGTPSILEVPTDYDTDCLIVLSTHKSKNQDRMLTAHIPGNWGEAGMGGGPRTLNIAAGSRLKIIMQELKREADLIGWKCSLEADHHGPTCVVPIIFVEIGTTEAEWLDESAGRAVANAVSRAIARNDTFETVFAIGGGHYPREFTKLELDGPLAMGHILPKYSIDALDDEMFRQAISRNVEKVTKVLISKDEANARQREKIIGMCGKAGIGYELV